MTNEQLARHLRILRQHTDTISARCKAVEEMVMRGEMWGVPVPEGKVQRQVRDIELRLNAAAALIGIKNDKHGT